MSSTLIFSDVYRSVNDMWSLATLDEPLRGPFTLLATPPCWAIGPVAHLSPHIFRLKEKMDSLRFNFLFNSSSVISGQGTSHNDWLCAMEPRSRLKIFPPPTELEPSAARSAGQYLN